MKDRIVFGILFCALIAAVAALFVGHTLDGTLLDIGAGVALCVAAALESSR